MWYLQINAEVECKDRVGAIKGAVLTLSNWTTNSAGITNVAIKVYESKEAVLKDKNPIDVSSFPREISIATPMELHNGVDCTFKVYLKKIQAAIAPMLGCQLQHINLIEL